MNSDMHKISNMDEEQQIYADKAKQEVSDTIDILCIGICARYSSDESKTGYITQYMELTKRYIHKHIDETKHKNKDVMISVMNRLLFRYLDNLYEIVGIPLQVSVSLLEFYNKKPE